jgi:hypothetical protein
MFSGAVEVQGSHGLPVMTEVEPPPSVPMLPSPFLDDEVPYQHATVAPNQLGSPSPAAKTPIIVDQTELMPPVIEQQSANLPLAAPAIVASRPRVEISSPVIAVQPAASRPSPAPRTANPQTARPAEFPHSDFGSKSEFAM